MGGPVGTIFMVMIGIFTVIGSLRLGTLLNKYQGVFGPFKAYIAITGLAVVAAGIDKGLVLGILFLLLAIAASYLLCFLFTRSLSPIVWFDMMCVGWGYTLRIMLRFVGIAMPYVEAKAKRDQEEYARSEAERAARDARQNEIQNAAYRQFGTRGQVSDDLNYWRPDENSDWVKVNDR